MSLHSPDIFKRDVPAGFDGQFEWDFLNSAFEDATGRNIKFMDIDAHVEVNGHHLIFETKHEGVVVTQGQMQALLSLWASGKATIVIVWGKHDPLKCQIFAPSGHVIPRPPIKYRGIPALMNEHQRRTVTRDWLWMFCNRWARWAQNDPHPFRFTGDVGE